MIDNTTLTMRIMAEINNHGPAGAADIASTLGVDLVEVSRALSQLRENKQLVLARGGYRLPSESGQRVGRSALVKTVKATPEPDTLEKIATSQDESCGMPESIMAQLSGLAEQLRPSPLLEQKMVKLKLLDSLAELIGGDVAGMLYEIRTDLQRLEGV